MSEESPEVFRVLPFYLVCDVSGSMAGEAIRGLNDVLPVLRDAVNGNPVIADVVELGIITFNDSPRVVMTLGNIEEGAVPQLSAGGGTKFGPALVEVRRQIEQDVARLKASGLKVWRPVVFFLSDGAPNDGDWENSFRALTQYSAETDSGFKEYPMVVPMGLGHASEAVLRQMIHPQERSKLYMVRDQSDAARAVAEMADVMLSSMIASVSSAQAGGDIHVLPTRKQLPAGIAVYGYEGGNEL
jgi:uncharacterized protein YegL